MRAPSSATAIPAPMARPRQLLSTHVAPMLWRRLPAIGPLSTIERLTGSLRQTASSPTTKSPLRQSASPRKIVRAACRIKARRQTELRLGNLAIQRDWGWAPEYVDAMWRILQHATAEDFVISTGEACSLESFTTAAFASVGLDWRDHVTIDEALHRPTEILFNRGNATKARAKLGWTGTSKMPTWSA